MKILVLNGSPRPEGNTSAMVQAFTKGAQSAGHSVKHIQVGNKHIAGCMSCEYCHTEGNGKCILQDEMQDIYPLLKEADMVVFASPIYYFTMSAQLEAVIQRFYAVSKPQKAQKSALLLSSYSPNVYSGAIAQYRDMSAYMGLKDMGIIASDNSQNKTPQKLTEIENFAKSL